MNEYIVITNILVEWIPTDCFNVAMTETVKYISTPTIEQTV